MIIKNRTLTFPKGTDAVIVFDGVYGTLTFSVENDAGGAFALKCEPVNGIAEVFLGRRDTGLYFFTASDGESMLSEQFLVYYNAYPKPSFGTDGVIYHVFVDRFFRGDGKTVPRNDSVYAESWDKTPLDYPEKPGAFIKNNNFYGGNLWGVAQKLDYIASLGTTVIYLSPVFEAYSNHKYDTGDYMKTDAAFGGDEALENLIEKAKEYKISIILDGVFNHTGDNSIYFDKYGVYGGHGAYSDPNSAYREWYTFEHWPDSYDCWWGIKVLPKVKSCASYESFICGEVLPKYLGMGAAGFRLDVVDELDAPFVEAITKTVKQSSGYVLGEVWEDASNKIAYSSRKEYFLGKQLDGVMNYPLREGIIDFLVWKNSVLLKSTLKTLMLHYPPQCLAYSMALLGTHDTERILTVLAGEYAGEHTNAELFAMRMTTHEYEFGRELLLSAFTLLFTLVGIPGIYYGDEVGMQGYRDPFNRRPFPWGHEDTKILEHVRALGALRRSGALSGTPDIKDSDEKTLVYTNGKAFVAVNMDSKPRTFAFDGKRHDLYGNKYKKEALAPAYAALVLTED
ncbi:MAG TPA: glycoside hydrolase family 13 protein [Bacillota bacterium]|nr:glycoside hydrolase family 13 protein [Bacillota bacterium]